MTKAEKDAIRARCEAATPGPWFHDGMHDEVHAPTGDCYWALSEGELPDHSDAKPIDKFGHRVNPNYVFAAHARQDIPALLDALEIAEADRDQWKARAEALERAVLMKRPGHHETRCYACVHHSKQLACRAKTPCHDGSQWQFDEPRFSRQEGTE